MRILLIFIFTYMLTNTLYSQESFYDLTLNSIDGDSIDFNQFKGKKVLIVNVASKCGFTPQYKGLEELQKTFKDELIILGVPCNQFGGQEPKNESEIKEFCSMNYGISFLMSEKIDVKGENQHNLYKWLTKKKLNLNQDSSVKWNFQKYLLDEKGEFVDYFYSTTKPMSSKIIDYLK
jgi:glutathione peroxidase